MTEYEEIREEEDPEGPLDRAEEDFLGEEPDRVSGEEMVDDSGRNLTQREIDDEEV